MKLPFSAVCWRWYLATIVTQAQTTKALANRYEDRYYTLSLDGGGLGLGILLLLGIAWLSFSLSDFRWLGYVCGGIFFVLGLNKGGGMLLMGIFLLASAAAGSYVNRERR